VACGVYWPLPLLVLWELEAGVVVPLGVIVVVVVVVVIAAVRSL